MGRPRLWLLVVLVVVVVVAIGGGGGERLVGNGDVAATASFRSLLATLSGVDACVPFSSSSLVGDGGRAARVSVGFVGLLSSLPLVALDGVE